MERPPASYSRHLGLVCLASTVLGCASSAPRGQHACGQGSPAIEAVRLTRRAFAAIRQERLRRGIPLDRALDPAGSGLIGVERSPVTTVRGSLTAKQTTANPAFAAVIVQLLREAGVRQGDVVAAGLSGSFPALNVAVLAAAQSAGLRALVVTSVSASQYGANHPRLLWPDIEQVVNAAGIRPRSAAMSLGGEADGGQNLVPEGRRLLERAVQRCGVPLIRGRTYAERLERRMALYARLAGGKKIRAYINVGGGAVSVGGRVGKHAFAPGLNRGLPPRAAQVDSVMTRLARQGVPVIHLVRIRELARRHGLPLGPTREPTRPQCAAVW